MTKPFMILIGLNNLQLLSRNENEKKKIKILRWLLSDVNH